MGLRRARSEARDAVRIVFYNRGLASGSKTIAFLRFFGGGPRESLRARVCGANPSSRPCPRRGPLEARKRPSKSQNLRMVLTVSSFLEWTIFGIRYSGFGSFRSKTRVSGLENLAFHICVPMVSAHGHVRLFCRISEAAFVCLFLAPGPKKFSGLWLAR